MLLKGFLMKWLVSHTLCAFKVALERTGGDKTAGLYVCIFCGFKHCTLANIHIIINIRQNSNDL